MKRRVTIWLNGEWRLAQKLARRTPLSASQLLRITLQEHLVETASKYLSKKERQL
jgi:hypothetical protein